MTICECSAEKIRNAFNDSTIAFLKSDIGDILKGKDDKTTTKNVKLYDSYNLSHGHIVKNFEKLNRQDTDTETWLISGASSAYGWMPRAIRLHTCHIDKAICSLEEIKKHKEDLKKGLSGQDCNRVINEITPLIVPLKNFIDNSIVGTSKFLHFSFPDAFPILDSLVKKALNCGHISKKDNKDVMHYVAYTKAVNELCKDKALMDSLNTISLLDEMDGIRKIEHALFLIGHMCKKKKK